MSLKLFQFAQGLGSIEFESVQERLRAGAATLAFGNGTELSKHCCSGSHDAVSFAALISLAARSQRAA